jgi:hypothetical protein
MTKEQMIQEILDEMREWPEDVLRYWALDLRADDLWKMNDVVLQEEYTNTFGDRQ